MSIGSEIAAHLPYLRRYARALTGSQRTGDAFVSAVLEAALADRELAQSLRGGRVPLYRAFSKLCSSVCLDLGGTPAASLQGENPEDPAGAGQRLGEVSPINRQALLLSTVEEFSIGEVGQIMDLAPSQVEALVREALREIEGEAGASVLIIEDEPLISMQLEDLVQSLGHEIFGVAATRGQVGELLGAGGQGSGGQGSGLPGLVLADIQLADGSSGLDAVDDILAIARVPVIFITAYPERLLTGDQPEPTYLITKPFREATVRAAISQALFFAGARLPA